MHEEELGINVLASITLDVTTLYLGNASGVIFIEVYSRHLAFHIQDSPDELDETSEPDALTTGLIESYEFRLIG
jgi:hypothetical protein